MPLNKRKTKLKIQGARVNVYLCVCVCVSVCLYVCVYMGEVGEGGEEREGGME